MLNPSKRNVLKTAGMFYDLLGLLVPITVRCKILFQEICKQKYAWDTFLSEYLVKIWTNFLLEMRILRELSFRRSVLRCAKRKVQLQGFAESSGVAYCAVTYVRVMCSHGVSCNLWTAGSRLLPTVRCHDWSFSVVCCCLS